MSRFTGRVAAIVGAGALAAAGVALVLSADNGPAQASRTVPAELPAASLPEADDETLVAPPPAAPRTREEQRFARADRDDDGRITQAEYLSARRRNYDKLDTNRDGRLSFEEYAVKGIEKFRGADADGNGQLVPGEFATTAPPRRQTPGAACNCARAEAVN